MRISVVAIHQCLSSAAEVIENVGNGVTRAVGFGLALPCHP